MPRSAGKVELVIELAGRVHALRAELASAEAELAEVLG
jgi:hypothetical protein